MFTCIFNAFYLCVFLCVFYVFVYRLKIFVLLWLVRGGDHGSGEPWGYHQSTRDEQKSPWGFIGGPGGITNRRRMNKSTFTFMHLWWRELGNLTLMHLWWLEPGHLLFSCLFLLSSPSPPAVSRLTVTAGIKDPPRSPSPPGGKQVDGLPQGCTMYIIMFFYVSVYLIVFSFSLGALLPQICIFIFSSIFLFVNVTFHVNPFLYL